MPITQAQQNLDLQKLFILATGSAANSSQISELNGMISQNGGMESINSLVDTYINQLISQQGSIVTYQAIAKNAFGVILSDAQAQTIITQFAEDGIDSGSKLLNFLSNMQNVHGDTLDNRSEAASNFLETLSAAGKSGDFTGLGVTDAVRTLLQNIGPMQSSLDNGVSGLSALSANLSATDISGVVD